MGGKGDDAMGDDGFRAGMLLKPYRGQVVIWLVLRLLAYGISLLPPWCYLLFLNEVILKGRIDFLWVPFGLYLLAFLGKTLLAVLEKRVYNRIFPAMTFALRQRLLKRYGQLDIEQLQKHTAGEWKLCLHNDTREAAQYWAKTLEGCILAAGIVITAGILLALNRILALCSFALLPLSFWVTRLIRGRSSTAYETERRLRGIWQDFMLHQFFFWKEIKTGGWQQRQQEQFAALWEKMGQASLGAHMYWFMNRTLLAFKDVFLTRMGLYLLGGILVVQGMTALPPVLAFVEYYGGFADRLLEFADIVLKRGEQEASIRRIGAVMSLPVARRQYRMERFAELKCSGLSFSWEKEHVVLRDFSMQLRRGERVAIVGESGCGKSTLLKLLAGYALPDAGEILWNGHPLEEVERDSLYGRIGFLMQESSLFNLSVRENLLFGKEDAAEQDLEEACRKANILDFVRSLPQGFETVIGENGIRLSGGQRQRLEIARLFLQDPEVIVFDEATSSLDYENESDILGSLLAGMGDKTLLMVTHRKTILTSCDRIVRMG